MPGHSAREGPAGWPPGVGGHEGAGIIEEIGPGVTKVKPGVRRALINRERVGEGSSGWMSSLAEREALDFGGSRGEGGSSGSSGAAVGPNGDVWFGKRDCDDVTWALARELGWEGELSALIGAAGSGGSGSS